MVKELKAVKMPITVLRRYHGRFTYLFCANKQYKINFMEALRSKGITVQDGREWLRYSLFEKNDLIILGGVTLDINETDPAYIQDFMCNFDKSVLEAQGFKCEVSEVG